jgi:hypothetical protein
MTISTWSDGDWVARPKPYERDAVRAESRITGKGYDVIIQVQVNGRTGGGSYGCTPDFHELTPYQRRRVHEHADYVMATMNRCLFIDNDRAVERNLCPECGSRLTISEGQGTHRCTSALCGIYLHSPAAHKARIAAFFAAHFREPQTWAEWQQAARMVG